MDSVNVNLANKAVEKIEKPEAAETAGSIAQAAPQLFTPTAETAGSIASAAPSAAGGSSSSFCAMG